MFSTALFNALSRFQCFCPLLFGFARARVGVTVVIVLACLRRVVCAVFAMQRSSSASSSSSSSSYSSSLSITSFVQYAFLAALAYILAGAPLSTLLVSRTNADSALSGSSLGAKKGVDTISKLENLVIPEKNLSCAAHAYKGVYVLSREPLVVYIEGFIGEEEAKEVVALRYVTLVPCSSLCIWTELYRSQECS